MLSFQNCVVSAHEIKGWASAEMCRRFLSDVAGAASRSHAKVFLAFLASSTQGAPPPHSVFPSHKRVQSVEFTW